MTSEDRSNKGKHKVDIMLKVGNNPCSKYEVKNYINAKHLYDTHKRLILYRFSQKNAVLINTRDRLDLSLFYIYNQNLNNLLKKFKFINLYLI